MILLIIILDIDERHACANHIAESCDSISYGNTKYNLTNSYRLPENPTPMDDNLFLEYFMKRPSILHCDCDELIRRCFSDVSSEYADLAGELFYSSGSDRCFKKEYPIVKCIECDEDTLFGDRCMRYELDETKSKIYQFFDLPHYYNSTVRSTKSSFFPLYQSVYNATQNV